MFKAHKWALILIMISILLISITSAVYAQENDINHANENAYNDSQEDIILQNPTGNQEDSNLNTPNNNPDEDEGLSNYPDETLIDSNENDNTMDNNIYYIDNSNYEEYMDYSFEENSIVYITEDIEGLDLYVECYNVTITGIDNPTLTNSHIIVYEEGYVNISNMTFVTNDESQFLREIELIGNNSSISNVNFTVYRYEPTEEEYRVILMLGDNNSLTDCNLDIKYPTQHLDWTYYGSGSKSIVVLVSGNNNNVTNCTMVLNESGYYEAPFGMIRGISIYGDNNNVSYCDLKLQGTLYCYAISCRGSYNYISFNDIDVVSIRYANGITLEGQNAYNLMENNNISLQTFNQTIDDMELVDVSYGIIITENEYHGYTYYIPDSVTIYNVIRNNYIRGNSSHVYGIEQFGGTYTTIENNTIIVDGYSPMGIGLIGKGANITNNRIIARGLTNESGVSADYIKPETTGISLKDGSDNLVANNYLQIDRGTAVNMRNERRNLITKNTMTVTGNVRYIMGDRNVNGSVFTDNVIEGNPQYSELSNDLVYVKGHTYVDGVIVANNDLESYLATHKQDTNATTAKNDTESGQNEDSTDYRNDTTGDSKTNDTSQDTNINPTNPQNTTINDTINVNQNTSTNQSSIVSNNTGSDTQSNQTSDDNEKSIIDEIIEKIDDILNNQTDDTQNQSTNNKTDENSKPHNDTDAVQNQTQQQEDNVEKNDTVNQNDTQMDENNTTQSDVIIENDTSQIPTDNKTEIPENTSQVIIEENQINQTIPDNENDTSENQTQEDNSQEQNNTQESDNNKNDTQTENKTTEIIVTNESVNTNVEDQTNDTSQQIVTNSTVEVNDSTETNTNATNKQVLNNSNQSQIDTDSSVVVPVTNNTTITNTTIEAEIEVENSTIHNRTNESTGAGDLSPDDANPSSTPQDSSPDASSQPVTLESIMEDILNQNTNEPSPATVGVTQTLSSSSAKILEVSPKIVSKKISFDNIKYLLAFILILMSALILGYKRVEV